MWEQSSGALCMCSAGCRSYWEHLEGAWELLMLPLEMVDGRTQVWPISLFPLTRQRFRCDTEKKYPGHLPTPSDFQSGAQQWRVCAVTKGAQLHSRKATRSSAHLTPKGEWTSASAPLLIHNDSLTVRCRLLWKVPPIPFSGLHAYTYKKDTQGQYAYRWVGLPGVRWPTAIGLLPARSGFSGVIRREQAAVQDERESQSSPGGAQTQQPSIIWRRK